MLAFVPRRLALPQAFAVFILLSIIWGGSVQNGSDWIWYLDDYEQIIASGSLAAAIESSIFEPGFVGLMYFAGVLGLSFQGFVLLCAVLNAGAWVYFSRHLLPKGNIAISSLFIFLINGWTLYNEQLRQALALSGLLIAYALWVRGSLRVALVWLIVSAMFHRSALFFVLVLVLDWYVRRRPVNWNSKKAVAIVVGSVALFVFGLQGIVKSGVLSNLSGNILVDKLIIYGDDESFGNSIFSLGMASYAIAFGVLVLAYRNVQNSGSDRIKYYWFVCLVWSITGPLLRTQSILTRFEHYMLPFVPLLLCYLWFVKTGTYKIVVMRAAILMLVFSFVVRVFMQPNQAVWVNSYQNLALSHLFSLEESKVDDRKLDICDNLRKNDSPFCDWR